MYHCNNCGALMEDCYRKKHSETHSETSPTTYEEWETEHCIECGSEDIEETFPCYLCGEEKAYQLRGEEWICDDCIGEVENIVRKSVLDVLGLSERYTCRDKEVVKWILADVIEEMGVDA